MERKGSLRPFNDGDFSKRYVEENKKKTQGPSDFQKKNKKNLSEIQKKNKKLESKFTADQPKPKENEDKNKIPESNESENVEDFQFKRNPTVRIKRENGNFIIRFQPIRISEIEEPLVPIEFSIPDKWSDDEAEDTKDESSDESDLDIEYIAPAAFMNQEVKEKPLLQVMKQQYDVTEVEKIISDLKEAELEAKLKAEEKEKKEQEAAQTGPPKKIR